MCIDIQVPVLEERYVCRRRGINILFCKAWLSHLNVVLTLPGACNGDHHRLGRLQLELELGRNHNFGQLLIGLTEGVRGDVLRRVGTPLLARQATPIPRLEVTATQSTGAQIQVESRLRNQFLSLLDKHGGPE